MSIDRVVAAIAIGVDDDAPPEFEPLQTLDRLASMCEGEVEDPTDVMNFVFGVLGFAPNTTHYYALSNSLLHVVLDHRRGNPLSLAIVAIEIGKRLGVHLVPVGMPAHFLMGFSSQSTGGPERWFDPFAGGRELTATDAKVIFDSMTPEASEFSVLMLEETPLPFVAGRVLANIKNAAVRAGDIGVFVAACELVLGIPGSGVNEHRVLARALGSSGRHDRAAEIHTWLAQGDPANHSEHLAAAHHHAAHRN